MTLLAYLYMFYYPISVVAFPQWVFPDTVRVSRAGMDFPKGDCLGICAGARMLVKVTLGCLFILVHVSFIHENCFNPYLEDSSSNLDFYPWNIPRFK